MSARGELLWVNRAVERFTGYTREECSAMRDYPLPLIVPADRDFMAARFREAAGGHCEYNVEFRVGRRDGSTAWMAASWQPMLSDDDQPMGFRTSVRDVAEKRQLRERLRLQNERLEQLVEERSAKIAQLEKRRQKIEQLAALGELAAGVAHEINNPLAGIRNAFELIKRQLPPSTKHYDKFELIDDEIQRISGITHQMYQLYRPSQQQATIFDIERSINQTITLARSMARKREVIIQDTGQPLPPTRRLRANECSLREGELKQILLNLIHNAIQASEAGKKVTVKVSPEGEQVCLMVRDQGCGIEPAALAKIFEPFFSTKAVQTGQGMGLGLSVTRGLIEAMGGSIAVKSQPGHGSTFTVTLPRELQLSP